MPVPQAVFIDRSACVNCGSHDLTELSAGSYRDSPLADFIAADPWGVDPLPHLQTATWSLVGCNACTQVFHRRILDAEWNERRLSEWMSLDAFQRFEAACGPQHVWSRAVHHVEHVLRVERLTSTIRAPGEPVRLLDFGCGFGTFLECCARFGFSAVGVDRSSVCRSVAKVAIRGELSDLGGQRFHAVTLLEVLEHLDRPSEVLQALHRHLLPGGVLVLETPDCTGVTGIGTHQDYLKIHPLDHINAFTHGTLKSIAERAGFVNIERGPALVTTSPARKILKYVLRKGERATQLYFRRPGR